MKFNVTLIDPPNYKYAHLLTDICRTIAYGLRDLGFECDLTVNSIDAGYTNIIVGTHLLTVADITAIIDTGALYIPLQSESVYHDPKSGIVSSSYQGQQFESIARPLMEHAVAVWDALTEVKLLRRLSIRDDKVKRFSMGYCQGLEDIVHRPLDRKDVDILFFGSITPHRAKIFATLQGLSVAAFQYGPSAFRNDMIARAKINLSLHSASDLDYFPQPRTGYLLNNKAFVLAETSIDHPAMRALVADVNADAFRERCAHFLSHTAELESQAEAAYEAYRHIRMADMLDAIL
jgi:hypothetical protein